MARFWFRPSQRLRSQAEFRRVMKHKLFSSKEFMRIYMAPNSIGRLRFGVSVGRKCGKAYLRNRLKRFGREAFRQSQHDIPSDFDYVLIFSLKMSKTGTETRPSLETLTFQEVKSSFLDMISSIMSRQAKPRNH